MEEDYIVRRIPQNATDTGRILNGVFKKRNLFEAIFLALPVAYISWKALGFLEWSQRIGIVIVPTVLVLAIGIFGFPPYSLTEFVNIAYKYHRTKHYCKYNPNSKWNGTPDFLINNAYSSIIDRFTALFEGASNREISTDVPVNENIYNPGYIERFNDDLGADDEKRQEKAGKIQSFLKKGGK